MDNEEVGVFVVGVKRERHNEARKVSIKGRAHAKASGDRKLKRGAKKLGRTMNLE